MFTTNVGPTREAKTDDNGNTRYRRVALCLAASYLEGDKQQALFKEAESLTQKSRSRARGREIENLHKWSENPSNPNLRQLGPATILKKIFSLHKLTNPALKSSIRC